MSSHSKDLYSSKKRKRTKTSDRRRWVFNSGDSSKFKDEVVVVSYNILGVENAKKHLDLYEQVSPRHLEWERRKRLIRKEIVRYKPSILCFQEVDRFSDLDNLLQEDGFQGIYKGRTGEACDGCAIFWKQELFTLLHQENVEFREFGLRDNVAQICVLEMNSHPANSDKNAKILQTGATRSLLIGNTHVLFNPNRGDIKLGQVRLLVDKAHKISHEWGSIPVIIAGDLNSVPQSAIYQFLASSELDVLLHDRKKLSGQIEGTSRWRSADRNGSHRTISSPLKYTWSNEELRLAAGNGGVTHMRHHLQLSSSYAGVPGSISTRDNCGEPLATSYHSKFMGTVDYIWHSKELIPLGVVETLPLDVLRKSGGLPSEKWGSDHLALVSKLAFVDDHSGT